MGLVLSQSYISDSRQLALNPITSEMMYENKFKGRLSLQYQFKGIYFYLILNKSKYEDEYYFIFPLVKYRLISKLENNYNLTIIAFDEYR